MKLKLIQLFLLLFPLLNFSCGEYNKIPYYQNLDHTRYSEESITNYTKFKIQKEDILSINVSSLNQEAASVFNTGSARVTGNNSDNSGTSPGYSAKVNSEGMVNLPLVGQMKVIGLTTEEVSQQLTSNLLPYLNKPIVNVRVLNFKISVFGDVLKPDVFTIQNEHVNINEALALAGDLNITAKRDNILLIREQNGKRQYFPVDLNKKEIFESPYYYLQNNDILYIEPDKTKYDNVSRGYRSAAIFLSGLSIVAIIASALLVQRR